jgi:adenine phosphoribosyltransferase
MIAFRQELLSRFRWINGHADILGLLAEDGFLERAAVALWQPFATAGATKVAGVEARGFIFGSAVAVLGGVGFVPIRKAGAIHPGEKVVQCAEPDWRGHEHELWLQRAALNERDRVLLVDDWAEIGSQAHAAKLMIEQTGGTYVGLSLLVDQLSDEARSRLQPVSAIVLHGDLPSESR